MITAAIFDIGGVLAHDVWEHMLLDKPDGIASRYGLDRCGPDGNLVERVGALLWEAFAYRPATQHNDWQALEIQYWRQFIGFIWGRQPPSDVSVDNFIQMTDDFINLVDAGMICLLERLQSRGIDLAICSNNNEFWFRRQMDKLSLHRFFSPSKVILSCRIGVSKSSPRFEMFHAVVDALRVAKSQCVFVDDRKDNVDRAKQFGIAAVRFIDVQQLMDCLHPRVCHRLFHRIRGARPCEASIDSLRRC